MNPTDTKAATTVDYAASIADWWETIGEEPNYPVSIDAVSRLLRTMDFDLPPNGLAYVESVGMFTPPGDDQWEASDIVFLIGCCQALQWFRREPDSVWWNRLSRHQRARAQARYQGCETKLVEGFERFSIRHLAILLLTAPNPEVAQQVFATIEARLEHAGID